MGIPSPPPAYQIVNNYHLWWQVFFIISLEFYMFSNFHEFVFFYNHKKVNEPI